MTDIQKMIEEASIKYSSQFAEENREESKDDFLHGANFALSQLQHANRWRKVSEDEYPQVQNEQYQILVRVSGVPYSATMWNIRDERDCDIMRRLSSSVEWKPIE